jgi:hypothetical protein
MPSPGEAKPSQGEGEGEGESEDGGRYVHVQACTCIHRTVPREHYAYQAKPRWR